jgi:YhcH/YjgK/YiaL family protein
MILDHLDNVRRYAALHPGFGPALEYLAAADWSAIALGRHEIDGERLFVLVARDQGRTRHGARLEAHRRYIDMQYVIEGVDTMGWRSLATCTAVQTPYDAERDIGFFADQPTSWFDVPTGALAIFFPDDAHAPLAGAGRPHKAVVKVAVDW